MKMYLFFILRNLFSKKAVSQKTSLKRALLLWQSSFLGSCLKRSCKGKQHALYRLSFCYFLINTLLLPYIVFLNFSQRIAIWCIIFSLLWLYILLFFVWSLHLFYHVNIAASEKYSNKEILFFISKTANFYSKLCTNE